MRHYDAATASPVSPEKSVPPPQTHFARSHLVARSRRYSIEGHKPACRRSTPTQHTHMAENALPSDREGALVRVGHVLRQQYTTMNGLGASGRMGRRTKKQKQETETESLIQTGAGAPPPLFFFPPLVPPLPPHVRRSGDRKGSSFRSTHTHTHILSHIT